jgi:hypothetical protein
LIDESLLALRARAIERAPQLFDLQTQPRDQRVNVNQQTNVATITPGYVIRLPAKSSVTDLPTIEREPLTIEGSR